MRQIRVIILIVFFVVSVEASTYGVKLSSLEKTTALTNSFVEKELHPAKPIFPKRPLKPKVPKAKELTKGKYEKKSDFELRIQKEKTERIKHIKSMEKEYAQKVKQYNKEVKKLTDNFNNDLAKKRADVKSITLSAMQKAYVVVYGTPYLENSLKYDAENETFYGVIKSTKGDFSEKVSFRVPIENAPQFEENIKNVTPRLVFKYEDEKLMLSEVTLKNSGATYSAALNSQNYKDKKIVVAINNGSLNLPASPLLSSSLDVSSADYAIGAINYSKDPEIAALQKKKYLLEKNVRDKKNSLARAKKLKAQRVALEAQIALLQDTKGGVDDIGILLKKSQTQKIDKRKWLFIVAIENYEYTDPVAYSANSASRFKEVMQKRLGISENNTRILINTGATSGKISYRLEDMLAHVKKGDTIYFYYSGHGIPVPSQKNAPYLLAQDMSPKYVADDARFKLQNIYKSLSNSKATKVIAFVDSCFSGGTDNQALIKGVAATRIKAKKVTFDKKKMIVLSAGSGTQYSNKYDAKSNRLFSYYVMRGLIKNNTDLDRLYTYVKSNVQEKSYEMGASYEQVPVYDGNIKMGI